MSIVHHPSDELLLSYAAGATHEAASLVIATHLALCPACRRLTAKAEEAGGALIESVQPAAMGEGALKSVLSRLDSAPVAKSRARAPSSVPEPLRSYVGGDLGQVPWKKITDGIAFLPLFHRGKTRAHLVRTEPGVGVGLHAHRGEELSMVLTGGYTDETGHYQRGDFHATSPDIVHRPVADEGEACIVLAMSEAPLKFRGLMDALIARWFGF